MRITDLISKQSIELNGKSGSKEETIVRMAELMARGGNVTNT